MQRERLCWAWGRRQQTPARKHAVKQGGFEGCNDIGCIWVMEPESGHRPMMHTCALQTWAMGCMGRAPNCAQLACQTVQVSFVFEVFRRKSCMCSPPLPGNRDIHKQRNEVELDRSFCLLEFLPLCNGKQKSVTGWQRSNYFKDKILGPNS